MTRRSADHDELAAYIVQWLRARNGEQLAPAIAAMTVGEFELLLEELAMILACGGHPPNWEPL